MKLRNTAKKYIINIFLNRLFLKPDEVRPHPVAMQGATTSVRSEVLGKQAGLIIGPWS